MPALSYSITISDEESAYLKSLIKTRTIQAQVVDRARILLWKSEAKTDKAIADGLGISVNTVRRCIDRYLNGGINLAIFDNDRSGRPVEITDDAKSWIISIACQKPCDLGYAAELWTLAALHKHIQAHAEEAGYPRLKTVTKPWLQKYLKKMDIKPFKIKYYCEKRDPDFEAKMHEVLLVYKQAEMQFDANGEIIVSDDYKLTITVSYDEKPGIQAVSNTSDDLRPTENNGEVYRDYEYKRLGTISLLAGIDLLTGDVLIFQQHIQLLPATDERKHVGQTDNPSHNCRLADSIRLKHKLLKFRINQRLLYHRALFPAVKEIAHNPLIIQKQETVPLLGVHFLQHHFIVLRGAFRIYLEPALQQRNRKTHHLRDILFHHGPDLQHTVSRLFFFLQDIDLIRRHGNHGQ